MFKYTLFALIVQFFSFNLALSPPYVPTCEDECKIQRKCSTEPPLAWATNGKYCKVFYNYCNLQNYNCQRLENGQCLLSSTTEKNCRENCQQDCPYFIRNAPVCTLYNGKSVTFDNECLWAQEMCKTGKAYIYQYQGACGY